MSMTVSSSIDLTQLFALFQATIQADEHVRKQAESHLKEVANGSSLFFHQYFCSWPQLPNLFLLSFKLP
jgi:hypothetical protein